MRHSYQYSRTRVVLFLLIITTIVVGCGSIPTFGLGGKKPEMSYTDKDALNGLASWYGGKFHGRRTANGEKYNKNGISAAHKTLPFNTVVRVTNLNNGRTLDVRINDRGPYVGDRVIDLSRAAAEQIGLIQPGFAEVQLALVAS